MSVKSVGEKDGLETHLIYIYALPLSIHSRLITPIFRFRTDTWCVGPESLGAHVKWGICFRSAAAISFVFVSVSLTRSIDGIHPSHTTTMRWISGCLLGRFTPESSLKLISNAGRIKGWRVAASSSLGDNNVSLLRVRVLSCRHPCAGTPAQSTKVVVIIIIVKCRPSTEAPLIGSRFSKRRRGRGDDLF
jgi:hypothetical protein